MVTIKILCRCTFVRLPPINGLSSFSSAQHALVTTGGSPRQATTKLNYTHTSAVAVSEKKSLCFSGYSGILQIAPEAAQRCVSELQVLAIGNVGAVQTLMSVDADRVVNLCVSLHELWSLPAQIALALYLLYTQVRLYTCISSSRHTYMQHL